MSFLSRQQIHILQTWETPSRSKVSHGVYSTLRWFWVQSFYSYSQGHVGLATNYSSSVCPSITAAHVRAFSVLKCFIKQRTSSDLRNARYPAPEYTHTQVTLISLGIVTPVSLPEPDRGPSFHLINQVSGNNNQKGKTAPECINQAKWKCSHQLIQTH